MEIKEKYTRSRTQRIVAVTVIIAIVCVLLTVGAKRYFYYGSIFRTCNYTARALEIPTELKQGTLELVQEAGTVTGSGEYVCLKNFTVNGRQIVEKQYAANWYGNSKEGSLHPPMSFKVKGVYEVTKHGISTIDSGPGPSYHLVVEDENNQEFTIPTAATGINPEEQFLQFFDGKERFILGIESFVDYGSPKSHFRFDKSATYRYME